MCHHTAMTNNPFSIFETSLAQAYTQVLTGLISFIPLILGALIVFLFGLFVANWVKSILVKIINLTKLSEVIANPAIKEFLKNAQVNQKIEDVIGETGRWLVIAIFFTTSINILGLVTVTNFLNSLFSYLPNLAAAIFILVIGVILAGIVEKLVKGSLGSIDISFSRLMGKISSYAVMIITSLAAISQMGIAQRFIELIFAGFIATLALALGLGLGLGSKDLIKSLLEGWYKNLKK